MESRSKVHNCIDCGKLHTKGQRCVPCCKAWATKTWAEKNKEYFRRYIIKNPLKLAMRQKKHYYLCDSCGKAFMSVIKTYYKKCPYCRHTQEEWKAVIMTRTEFYEFNARRDAERHQLDNGAEEQVHRENPKPT